MSSKIIKPGIAFNRNGYKKYKITILPDETIVVYKRSLFTLGLWVFYDSYSIDHFISVENDLNEKYELTLKDIYVIGDKTYNLILNH